MDLSLKSLQEAVGIREQIDALEKQLAALFQSATEIAAPSGSRKRTMSAAARKTIEEAQRARWASKKTGAKTSVGSTANQRRTGSKRPPMSAEARARLAASAKRRWAAAKRAGKSRL